MLWLHLAKPPLPPRSPLWIIPDGVGGEQPPGVVLQRVVVLQDDEPHLGPADAGVFHLSVLQFQHKMSIECSLLEEQ